MQTWSRKRIETIFLAVLSVLSVSLFRVHAENCIFFFGEMISVAALAIVLAIGKPKRLMPFVAATLAVAPIVCGVISRWFATPVAFEITALATFGVVSLAMAVGGQTSRWRALSLVVSGFLVLFCAAISEQRGAIVIPVLWMLGCVWHLVANRWEWLDLAMPDTVSRTWKLRPGTVAVTALVLAVCVYAMKDRIKESGRFTMGIMPTSGGSKWSDPAARSGVGTGDAAIAAKDHAESFGAVDSEIFLESTEPALFDMVNDLIGEPKQKLKWEKKQAIGSDKVLTSHERTAKTEQGGGSFSTDRMPPKKHRHFDTAHDPGIVQWDGPTGIRLGLHRYDTYDGQDWIQNADYQNDKLLQRDVDNNVWFFDPVYRNRMKQKPEEIDVGLIKIIRLDSPRFPTPMMTAGVHIKDVVRQDFFGLEKDGSLYMPERDKVPSLTVAHIASFRLSEDDLMVGCGSRSVIESSYKNELLGQTVKQITANIDSSHDRLRAIVDYLRTEFVFDRDHAQEPGDPVTQFLKCRRGGDHLFATTAALMAKEIGLPSRLVTGFYVRPDAFDYGAGHASVLPRDVHVWAEIRLADGRWFEIEPTPGYLQPKYRPSLWLVAKRFAAAYWPVGLGLGLFGVFSFLTRRVWIDWSLHLVWLLAGWLRPRPKLGLAMKIIETRARLAGERRPQGCSQRDWMEQLTRTDENIYGAAERFCDTADALFFGSETCNVDSSATQLVRLLSVPTISRLSKGVAA